MSFLIAYLAFGLGVFACGITFRHPTRVKEAAIIFTICMLSPFMFLAIVHLALEEDKRIRGEI